MIKKAVALCLVLAACGEASDDIAYVSTTLASVAGTAGEPTFVPRFANLVQTDPEVLQIYFEDRGVGGNLGLERQDGEFAYWLSPFEGSHLILQSGMLHSTRGLGEELLASELSEPLALVRSMRSGFSDRFHTYLDGTDRAVTRTYRCRIDSQGVQPVELNGQATTAVLMQEDCNSLDQEFVNFYWVQPSTGSIVQATQWVGPEVGRITTRVVPR